MRRINKIAGAGGHMASRACLLCGMQHNVPAPELADRAREPVCTKCDSPLFSQGDGSTVTADIAHHHETVTHALEKFEQILNQVWQRSYASQVRLIVGGGLIRDAVLAELYFKKSQGTVLDFTEENRGAVLVSIRRTD